MGRVETLGLIPQDERPVSLSQPKRLMEAAGARVLTPPLGLLGHRERPGNPEALGRWLLREAPRARAWALSLDMLAYGGLVASRELKHPLEVALRRLDILRQAKKLNPQTAFMGFQAIRRLSVSIKSSRDVKAWRRHHEQESLLKHRERNHRVNLKALELLHDNSLDFLALLQEDAKPRGRHKVEQKVLQAFCWKYALDERFVLAPGADEGALALLARSFLRIQGRVPKIKIVFSSERGSRRVIVYEDRPLRQTVSGQLAALGAAPGPGAATELWIWCPDRPSQDLWLEGPLPLSGQFEREMNVFIGKLARALAQGRRIVLADTAYANGADPHLMERLSREIPLGSLLGYSAWNTAANTLGFALAQAALGVRDRTFPMLRLWEDWGYQSMVRPGLREWARGRGFDEWRLKSSERRQAEAWLKARMNDWRQETLAPHFRGIKGRFRIRLPWSRLFEVDICPIS
ncbi:MAG: DUF4127 family protein [Elusimicrobia bacterium]|nr:DUF4127 family protein [Elusimicrobiota bacterium]